MTCFFSESPLESCCHVIGSSSTVTEPKAPLGSEWPSLTGAPETGNQLSQISTKRSALCFPCIWTSWKKALFMLFECSHAWRQTERCRTVYHISCCLLQLLCASVFHSTSFPIMIVWTRSTNEPSFWQNNIHANFLNICRCKESNIWLYFNVTGCYVRGGLFESASTEADAKQMLMWGPLKKKHWEMGIQCEQASGKATACLLPHPALYTKLCWSILQGSKASYFQSL